MGKNEDVISQDLLEMLACPLCKTGIELIEVEPQTHGLRCNTCGRIYPIKDGIPVMLVDEAIAPTD